MSLALFARLCKVDEEKRLVYGRLADDSIDHSGEAMDYEKSKPYFQAWSATIAKESGGKSVGNLRAMHGKVAAGKFTEIEFNDTDKAINVVAKVVDDHEWKKVLEGVYTGFSIGGSYVGDPSIEKIEDVEIRRYVANPSEGSLVDRPCNKNALFFDVQKADGSLAKVNFQTAAEPAKTEPTDLVVKGTPEEVATLATLMNDAGLTMADVLAKLAEPKVDPVAPTPEETEKLEKVRIAGLAKSMWMCADFANVIASLQSLQTSAAYAAYFDAGSTMAQRLGACIALCGQVLKEMIDEEIGETPSTDVLVMELAQKVASLAKSIGEDVDPLLALVKAGARNSAIDKKRIQAIHDSSSDLGADCAADKAHGHGDLTKALSDATEPLQKRLDETTAELAKVNDELTKIKAQPEPARVNLRAVTKGADVADDTTVAPVKPAPVVDDKGEAHEAAGLIKGLHRTGGAPLHAH